MKILLGWMIGGYPYFRKPLFQWYLCFRAPAGCTWKFPSQSCLVDTPQDSIATPKATKENLPKIPLQQPLQEFGNCFKVIYDYLG